MHPLVELSLNIHDAFLSDLEPKTSVFLVGASLSDKNSMRYKLGKEIQKANKFQVYYPEFLFDELLYSKHYNFLEMENILALSVDSVIICPESAGSLVELGAFSNYNPLNKKLIVIQNSAFKRHKSFINIGPMRYLQSQTTSKVYWVDYKNPDIKLNNLVNRIYSVSRVINKETNASLKKISIMEQFILILFYVLGETSQQDAQKILYDILEKTSQKEFFPLACALLGSHIKQGNLKKPDNCYDITEKGIKLMFSFSKKVNPSQLDKFRVRALTLQMRRRIKFGEQAANS